MSTQENPLLHPAFIAMSQIMVPIEGETLTVEEILSVIRDLVAIPVEPGDAGGVLAVMSAITILSEEVVSGLASRTLDVVN